MKCPQCDADISDDSVFCSKCGERLQGLGSESFAELRDKAGPETPANAPAGPAPSPAQPLAPESPASPQPAKPPQPSVPGTAEATLGDAVTLWTGRYSLRGMIDRLILSALVSMALVTLAIWLSWGHAGWLMVLALLVAIWGYQLGVYVVHHFGHRYRLTPQTFFHERGILIQSTSPIEIVRIDDIAMKQSLLERLLGVGTIRILSKDTTDPLLVMKGIADVNKAFQTIDQARRAERRRRALRVDAV